MKALKRPLFRKVFLIGFLAVAGLLLGDIFQHLTQQKPEDILLQLHAQQIMSQSLQVNGVSVVADVWELPETSSATPLRKARGKSLIVGRLVYLFSNIDLGSLRGQCVYPDELPPWPITCDYAVDTGLSQFVSGTTAQTPEDTLAALDASAKQAGWTARGARVWQKGHQTLFAQASNDGKQTHAMLILKKELP